MVTKKRTKPKIKKKALSKPNKFSFPTGFPFKTRIKVIGIGGGGGSIVSEIAKSLKKASFVIADTDVRALKKSSAVKRFYFGQDLTHGLGTGMNPELARTAAEKEKEKIAKIFKDQDITILIASLGGGVGSGATPIFADIARNSGSITLGIFTLPFKFEGGKKSKIANNSLQSLRDSLNASVAIANERIFKIIDEKTSITQAFSVVNKNLIESLESLIETIYNPGLINIDFADIQTILKGKGKSAFLNTYQAGGKNAAEEIIKNIFNNPLYNYNLVAEKILFNISGGNNLSMVDVEKISKSIASLNPKAKIIFGISRSSKCKNKIRATLLITGIPRLAFAEAKRARLALRAKRVDNGTKKEPSFASAPAPSFAKATTDKKATEGKGKKPSKKKKPGKLDEKSKVKKPAPASALAKATASKKATALPSEALKERRRAGKKATASKEKKEQKIEVKEKMVHQVKSARGGASLASPSRERSGPEEKQFNRVKKTKIRRNALEIKKAEEIEESKKLAQEKEWEIPAFLRRIK